LVIANLQNQMGHESQQDLTDKRSSRASFVRVRNYAPDCNRILLHIELLVLYLPARAPYACNHRNIIFGHLESVTQDCDKSACLCGYTPQLDEVDQYLSAL